VGNGILRCMGKESKFRRYKDYDYSRGATLFITFSTEPRRSVFGRVVDGKMYFNQFGQAARETLETEMKRNPALTVMRHVIMPDHVHLLVHVRAFTGDPLRQVGQFVSNFKRWTKYKVEKLGATGFGWQKNYHDWICSTQLLMDTAGKYISNNEVKWSLMHGENPPLKVIEPLAHWRFPPNEWWSGVGRTDLLDRKIAAIRLSRKIPQSEFGAVVSRLLAACDKGYTLASTFISPCEQIVASELAKREIAFIKMVPDKLATVYRPKNDEPVLFSKGLYLLLSRVAGADASRSAAWHGINDALAGMAELNGLSLYVQPNCHRLHWNFSPTRSLPAQITTNLHPHLSLNHR